MIPAGGCAADCSGVPVFTVRKDKKRENAMVAAVRVHKAGGPEVLTFEDVELPAPGAGQVRVKQAAQASNYIDTYFRAGAYPPPAGIRSLPAMKARATSLRSARA